MPRLATTRERACGGCYCASMTRGMMRQLHSVLAGSSRKVMADLAAYENATELYAEAERRWPSRRSRPGGQWILASFDQESIVVYQAYNSDIAEYACANGRFVDCPGYNEQRMTCKTDDSSFSRSSFISARDQNELPLDDVPLEVEFAFQSRPHSRYSPSSVGVRRLPGARCAHRQPWSSH